MVLTNDVHLPEESELTVPEVNLSGSSLIASAFHLGKYCENANNEYMLCRFEEKDVRKCINEGKAVTACTFEFFKKVKQSCMSEFNQYSNCVDKSSGDYGFKQCRKTQGVFDGCMLEKLNIERPPFGYFTEARVHDTKSNGAKTIWHDPEQKTIVLCFDSTRKEEAQRNFTVMPKPLPEPKAEYPDATPALPEDAERKPARLGSRFYWMTE